MGPRKRIMAAVNGETTPPSCKERKKERKNE